MPLVSLCVTFGVAFVVLFVSATLLRAATALANRVIGPVKTEPAILWGDWDSDEDDEIVAQGSELAVPEPGLGRGMLIVFLSMLASVIAGVVVRSVLDSDELGLFDDEIVRIAALLFAVMAGFLTLIGLLAGMLPTKAKWAALTAFFMFAILFLLLSVAFGVVYLVLG